MVWNLADVTMGFMAIVNILVIFVLGRIALAALKDYEKQKKEHCKHPKFLAKNIGLTNTEEWK
jgi:AGCS family alanine or glycine:cation symporter